MFCIQNFPYTSNINQQHHYYVFLYVCAGVCELGGKLYCIGGWNGQVGIKQCDVFDPDSQQWTTIASLLTGKTIVDFV